MENTVKYEVWVMLERPRGGRVMRQFFCKDKAEAIAKVTEWMDMADRGDTCMKPFNEYLAMSAEALLADPEAPESLVIAARIELEKAKMLGQATDEQE